MKPKALFIFLFLNIVIFSQAIAQVILRDQTLYESAQSTQRSIYFFRDAQNQRMVEYSGGQVFPLSRDNRFFSPAHGFAFSIHPTPAGSNCFLLTWPNGRDTLCESNNTILQVMELNRVYVSRQNNGRSIILRRMPNGQFGISYFGNRPLPVSMSGSFYSPGHGFSFSIKPSHTYRCVNLYWPGDSDTLCQQ
jgi:hypothetical protein